LLALIPETFARINIRDVSRRTLKEPAGSVRAPAGVTPSQLTTASMSFGVPLPESESEFPSYPHYPQVGALDGCETQGEGSSDQGFGFRGPGFRS